MSQPGLSVVKCDHIYRDSKHTCNEYVRGPWFPATATGQSSSSSLRGRGPGLWPGRRGRVGRRFDPPHPSQEVYDVVGRPRQHVLQRRTVPPGADPRRHVCGAPGEEVLHVLRLLPTGSAGRVLDEAEPVGRGSHQRAVAGAELGQGDLAPPVQLAVVRSRRSVSVPLRSCRCELRGPVPDGSPGAGEVDRGLLLVAGGSGLVGESVRRLVAGEVGVARDPLILRPDFSTSSTPQSGVPFLLADYLTDLETRFLHKLDASIGSQDQ